MARGDLSETIDVEARGEIAELKTTVNGMVSSSALCKVNSRIGDVATDTCR